MKQTIGPVLVAFILVLAISSPSAAVRPAGPSRNIIATPHPTARPAPRPRQLPAPKALHYTTDLETCADHGGSTHECARLKGGRAVAFYWSWTCSGKDCALGGYRVWIHVPTHPVAGAKAPPDRKRVDSSKERFIIMNEPHGGWVVYGGSCYFVTSFPASGHAAAESKPSPTRCVQSTSKEVTIKANTARGYSREWSVLYSDNNPQITTYMVHKLQPMVVGGSFIVNAGQSQANTFSRAAYAYSLSSIRWKSVFGGTFAYDRDHYDSTHSCAELHLAPTGWKSASWIAPTGRPLSGKYLFAYSGSTFTWPIDSLIEKWDRSKPLALLLMENNGPAEFIKSGLVPRSFTCQSTIVNPRLLIKVSVTE